MNMCSYSLKLNSREFKSIRSLSNFLKLVGEENRLKILCLLSKKEQCVCKILESFPDMSQSLISHHLANLKKVNLVIDRKDGLWSHYSLTQKGQKIIKTIFSIREEI